MVEDAPSAGNEPSLVKQNLGVIIAQAETVIGIPGAIVTLTDAAIIDHFRKAPSTGGVAPGTKDKAPSAGNKKTGPIAPGTEDIVTVGTPVAQAPGTEDLVDASGKMPDNNEKFAVTKHLDGEVTALYSGLGSVKKGLDGERDALLNTVHSVKKALDGDVAAIYAGNVDGEVTALYSGLGSVKKGLDGERDALLNTVHSVKKALDGDVAAIYGDDVHNQSPPNPQSSNVAPKHASKPQHHQAAAPAKPPSPEEISRLQKALGGISVTGKWDAATTTAAQNLILHAETTEAYAKTGRKQDNGIYGTGVETAFADMVSKKQMTPELADAFKAIGGHRLATVYTPAPHAQTTVSAPPPHQIAAASVNSALVRIAPVPDAPPLPVPLVGHRPGIYKALADNIAYQVNNHTASPAVAASHKKYDGNDVTVVKYKDMGHKIEDRVMVGKTDGATFAEHIVDGQRQSMVTMDAQGRVTHDFELDNGKLVDKIAPAVGAKPSVADTKGSTSSNAGRPKKQTLSAPCDF